MDYFIKQFENNNFLNNNKSFNNTRGREINKNNSRKTKIIFYNKNTVYMNIDVVNGMCQGITELDTHSIPCTNKAQFNVKNKFNLCDIHRHQKICY